MAPENTDVPISSDPLIGRVFDGKYRVVDFLGAGGMSRVYKAEQIGIGRFVALKILKGLDGVGPEDRVIREAQALCSLNHPNVVEVFAYGKCDGAPYLAMELVEGTDLAAIEKQGPLDLAQFLHIFTQVASALSAIHSKGLIHRDVTPKNIMLLGEGQNSTVRLVDFGIVKFTGSQIQQLTRTGAIIGTPHYMSPEQFGSEEIDCRADVYSLGCVMHEALSGNPPFTGESPYAVLLAQSNTPPPPLPKSVPLWLRSLVDAMLVKSAHERIHIDAVQHCLRAQVAPDAVPRTDRKRTPALFGKAKSVRGFVFLALLAGFCCLGIASQVTQPTQRDANQPIHQPITGVSQGLNDRLADLERVSNDFVASPTERNLTDLNKQARFVHQGFVDMMPKDASKAPLPLFNAARQFQAILGPAIRTVKESELDWAKRYAIISMVTGNAVGVRSFAVQSNDFGQAVLYGTVVANNRKFLAVRTNDESDIKACAEDFHLLGVYCHMNKMPKEAREFNKQGVKFCTERQFKHVSYLCMVADLCIHEDGPNKRSEKKEYIDLAVPILLKQDFSDAEVPSVVQAAICLVLSQIEVGRFNQAMTTSNRTADLARRVSKNPAMADLVIRALMQNSLLLASFDKSEQARRVYEEGALLARNTKNRGIKKEVENAHRVIMLKKTQHVNLPARSL